MNVGSVRFSRRRTAVCALVIVGIAIISSYVVFKAYHYPMFDLRVNSKSGSFRGYTLFAFTVDDIGQELEEPAEVYLIDMDGVVVHSWRVLGSVQLVKLKPNGNLFYITRDRSFKPRAGLREIDPFGNVIWHYECWANHDFCLLPNGNVLINYIEDSEVPAIGPGKVRSPRIVEVTPQKDVIWEWRAEEHLNELRNFVGITFPLDESLRQYKGDVLDWAHNNTCQAIAETETALRDPRFAAGDILFSYRSLDVIGVISKESGEILWAWGPGTLDGQHNPRVMGNGNILLFDNGTRRGYSRVIEFDPVSNEIVWEYSDQNSQNPEFVSPWLSGAQPLPNGNVLICQGGYRSLDNIDRFYNAIRKRLLRKRVVWSRMFEVNRSGTVVWEMVVNQSGDDKIHNVYQATRYSENYVKPLLSTMKKTEDDETRRLKSLPYMQ
jgi:hypothetical protein